MKYLYILIVLCVGCAKMATSHAAVTLHPPGEDGGVSGGGGFFLQPLAPVGANHGVDSALILKQAFDYIFNLSETFEESEDRATKSKVLYKFLSSEKLHDTLEKIKPLNYENGPCLNKYQEAVDGSLFSFAPNTICVSAFNLKAKVHPEDMFPQSVGILIHEYSEIVGMTEEEAVALQKVVIDEVRAGLPAVPVSNEYEHED